MEPKDAKGRIVRAAIELMQQAGCAEELTMRLIAERAGVGVGLVNYHFQTKERLLEQAVQVYIAEVISSWPARHQAKDPVERLKSMLKATARFLSEHANVSRISIHQDLLHPSPGDHSIQTIEAMLPVLREAVGGGARESDLRLMGVQLTALLQVFFLRKDVCREYTGVDFDSGRQRDRLVEQLVDQVLSGHRSRR